MVIDNESKGYKMMKALTKITKKGGLVREIYNEHGDKINDAVSVGQVIARNLPFRTERQSNLDKFPEGWELESTEIALAISKRISTGKAITVDGFEDYSFKMCDKCNRASMTQLCPRCIQVIRNIKRIF